MLSGIITLTDQTAPSKEATVEVEMSVRVGSDYFQLWYITEYIFHANRPIWITKIISRLHTFGLAYVKIKSNGPYVTKIDTVEFNNIINHSTVGNVFGLVTLG